MRDVQDEILAAVAAPRTRRRGARRRAGRSCSRPRSRRDEAVPPFPNTAMDGYAVRAADTAGASADAPGAPAGRRRARGGTGAGRSPVGAGEAIRIMTGAPMPEGADAIVMVEQTRPTGDGVGIVEVGRRAGQHVREAGGDLARGSGRSSRPGRCSPRRPSACSRASGRHRCRSSRGRGSVCCRPATSSWRRGRSRPGKIRDSNRPMLLGLAREAGLDAVDLGIARDDEAADHRDARGRVQPL